MSTTTLRPWWTITREERFFTAILFHDIRQNPEPFWSLLRESLGCSDTKTVIDSGFEVCFFRDARREDLIEAYPKLEKQTFDLVLWLSNEAMVIIEAKAQQGFHTQQLTMLQDAKQKMQSSKRWPIKQIYLVGLCSARYSPKPATRHSFDALIRWDKITEIYPSNKEIYGRANKIYGK